MKPPRKPTLNTLKGSTVISPDLREALGINEGVLVGQLRNWSNISFLVDSYFEHVEDYNFKGDDLFSTMLSTLDDLSELKLIDQNNKKQKKSGADRLVLINDSVIMVPQAKLFKDYCRSMKAYLLSPKIKSSFLFKYAKARDAKQKESERIRRQEEEKEEKAKMLHNGKMIAYLAAEKGSFEIQDDLQSQISQETRRKREKGKEKVVGEEDQRRTRARTASPAPEDDNGLVNLQLLEVVAFLSNIFLFLI
ncbi:uncharacterized protein B0P05DRAFT_240179 [Gilbertella persicaria]|uniref:uncharacterized protein n=1 Tax=Gilbertella persicaria TaxID=101096 RepID=UPI00221E9E3D|nr:uncharacterized protein B0P05DRAFT_240179 [Gilbertella persicaria]KAI8063419.1 hypothetical protein B0P05DRAFT_240179 [Gilbertella persicaria]